MTPLRSFSLRFAPHHQAPAGDLNLHVAFFTRQFELDDVGIVGLLDVDQRDESASDPPVRPGPSLEDLGDLLLRFCSSWKDPSGELRWPCWTVVWLIADRHLDRWFSCICGRRPKFVT